MVLNIKAMIPTESVTVRSICQVVTQVFEAITKTLVGLLIIPVYVKLIIRDLDVAVKLTNSTFEAERLIIMRGSRL
jgi:hypothetical protein